ncbi:glycoside hydrolase domain-containing protein [Streptomyces sp. NPDC004787]|uniref:glycoside hydrolase domain-containing protein n=1 Tax=Streptomyces sp. NPDC004787 TaxID=3154291 RepID=UPI0033A193A1
MDFDATGADMDVVIDYFRGARAALGRTNRCTYGFYGSRNVCSAVTHRVGETWSFVAGLSWEVLRRPRLPAARELVVQPDPQQRLQLRQRKFRRSLKDRPERGAPLLRPWHVRAQSRPIPRTGGRRRVQRHAARQDGGDQSPPRRSPVTTAPAVRQPVTGSASGATRSSLEVVSFGGSARCAGHDESCRAAGAG